MGTVKKTTTRKSTVKIESVVPASYSSEQLHEALNDHFGFNKFKRDQIAEKKTLNQFCVKCVV